MYHYLQKDVQAYRIFIHTGDVSEYIALRFLEHDIGWTALHKRVF